MRLSGPTGMSPSSAAAPTSGVSSGGGGEYRSGSMPSSVSSLDYKVKNRSNNKLTTTKPPKRKNQGGEAVPPEDSREYQEIQRQRARTSGLPDHRYDLSDLEGMSEEELMQAFLNDPALATAASEAAEKMQQKQKRQQRQKGQRSRPRSGGAGSGSAGGAGAKQQRPGNRYHRAADGTVQDVTEYPDHLREMMDGGVPVFQWIILTLLLGAGMFQLHKTFSIPAASKKKTAAAAPTTVTTTSRSKGVSGGGKKKADKRKVKKFQKNVSADASTRKESDEAFIPILLDEPNADTKPPVANGKKAKKSSSPKKKKASSKKSNAADKKTDDVLAPKTNDGADAGTTSNAKSAKAAAPIHDDVGGWHTVSKDGKSNDPNASEEVAPAAEAEAIVVIAEASVVTTAEKENDVPTKASGPAKKAGGLAEQQQQQTNQQEEKPKQPSKKKKKQKKNKIIAPVEDIKPSETTAIKSTDEDMALAMKLQQEEEKIAKSEAAGEVEEVWEEVVSKKKKPVKEEDSC